jgi:glucose-6-phosphate-specific signal transduction histidine kinase
MINPRIILQHYPSDSKYFYYCFSGNVIFWLVRFFSLTIIANEQLKGKIRRFVIFVIVVAEVIMVINIVFWRSKIRKILLL